MTLRSLGPIGAVVLIAACSPQQGSAPVEAEELRQETAVAATRAPAEPDPTATAPSATPARDELAAPELVLAEWSKAENRSTCAPASFIRTGANGTPRRATFSGGWAVAWDRPGMRSAFGVAGTGFVPEAPRDAKAQRARLAAQWPFFRELPALPQRAFAGYGVEGAGDYADDNSDGRGVNSLAYVRIGGQACDYNVWSRLGRAHLESLLDNLRMVVR